MRQFKYSGLISVLLLAVGILVISFGFDYSQYPNFAISDFGRAETTGLYFNILMIICGLLNVVFVTHLKVDYKISWSRVLLLYLGSLAVVAIGVFPLPVDNEPVRRGVHWLFGLLLFIAYPLGIMVFGNALHRTHKKHGQMSIEIALLALMFGFVLMVTTGSIAIAEVAEFVGIAIWVAYMAMVAESKTE